MDEPGSRSSHLRKIPNLGGIAIFFSLGVCAPIFAYELFDRYKFLSGLKKACEKRPVSVETIEHSVDAIEVKLQELCVPEVPSRQIGDIVMEQLKSIDKIAYVRFASVYREFSDVSQFVDTLQSLVDEPERSRPARSTP